MMISGFGFAAWQGLQSLDFVASLMLLDSKAESSELNKPPAYEIISQQIPLRN
jgi:hypothetical protein